MDEVTFEYFGVRFFLAISAILILTIGILAPAASLGLIDPHHYASQANSILIPGLKATVIGVFLTYLVDQVS